MPERCAPNKPAFSKPYRNALRTRRPPPISNARAEQPKGQAATRVGEYAPQAVGYVAGYPAATRPSAAGAVTRSAAAVVGGATHIGATAAPAAAAT